MPAHPAVWRSQKSSTADSHHEILPAGDELSALVGAGALPVGLGPQRLRVETAAIAMLAGAGLHIDSLQIDDSSDSDGLDTLQWSTSP